MTVLIIEDDTGLTELIKENVEMFGFQTISVQSAGEAIEWLKLNKPYLMILDYRLPDMNGKEFVAELQKTDQNIPPFIVSTGQGDEQIAVEMMKLGARDYLVKDRYFLKKLPEVIKRINKEIENENKRKQAEEKLNQSEIKYYELYTLMRLMSDTMPDLLWAKNLNKQYIFVNKAHCKKILNAVDTTEAIGKTDLYFAKRERDLQPENPGWHTFGELCEDSDEITIKEMKEMQFSEFGYIRGKFVFLDVHKAPMFNKSGELIGIVGSARDITDSKSAEEKLRQNEERLNFYIKNSPMAVIEWDSEFRISRWTGDSEKIFGWSAEETIGKKSSDLNMVFEQDLFVEEDVKKKLVGGGYNQVTSCNRNYRKDRSMIYCEWYNIVMNDPSGKMISLMSQVLDITDRKKAEEALLEAEWKFRALFEKGPIGVAYHKMVYDATGKPIDYRFLDANQTYIELTGVDPRNKTATEAFPNIENDPSDWIGLFSNVVLTGKSVRFEKYLQPNGRWYDCVAYRYKANHFVAAFFEITKNKKIEENLRKLSRAVEQSQVSIVITNKNAIIEYVNPKFLDVTGYTMDEVIGKNPNILKSGEFTGLDYKEMWNFLISGKEWSGIFHNKKKNGELFWESATISPVKNEKGEITHFVAVKEDITAKKQMELNLEKALARAEEINRLKSSFLANMNHELRTPLNGILGFAGFLSEELKDENQSKMASAIFSSGKRLSETLNLILDLSNVEAEKIEVCSKQLEVVSIIKNIAGLFAAEALQKNLDLKIANNEDIIYAFLDDQLFSRVIYNLIDNAIKYTDKGSITIEIGIEKQDKNKLFYTKIKDTGIGIPKDKIEIIWDAFRQVSEGLNRGYEGSGLGLTICQKITKFMNGTIEVESALGKGSEFIVKFPVFTEIMKEQEPIIEKEVEIIAPLIVDKPIKPLPIILYVEDDEINQNVIKLFVKNRYLIDVAADAKSALQLVEQKKYDIILMDINLGRGMNGIQVTKEIRNNPNYYKTPIVAVTAYTIGSDKTEFFKAGCTHYLAKPFLRNDLLNLLEEININE
ncbi:MAG: PAS domain S-box protein [bacterium]